MRTTVFEVKKNGAGKWFWHEKAANGRIVDVSQAYSTKSSAVHRARMKAAQSGGVCKVIDTAH